MSARRLAAISLLSAASSRFSAAAFIEAALASSVSFKSPVFLDDLIFFSGYSKPVK
jgi:hypothetical protein